MKLLLVEDESSYRYLIRRILNLPEDSLLEAERLEEARALLQRNAVDALLLDINLPDGSGYDFCAELRAAAVTQKLPVLMLTIRSRPEEWLRGFEAGADDYLPKPFKPEELRKRLNDLLEKSVPAIQCREREIHAYGPDHALVRVAQRGNPRAFEVLMKIHEQKIPPFVRPLVSENSTVEEITAQTVAEAFGALDRFQHRSRFITWLRRIGRHVALRSRGGLKCVPLEEPRFGQPGRWPEALIDRGPEAVHTQRLAVERVRRALKRVPSPYRKTLRLFAMEGKTYEEIGARQGIATGTVMSRLNRARRYFRLAWERQEKLTDDET